MLNIGQLGAAATNEHVLQKLGWQMVNLPMETANAFANWYLCYASEYPEGIEGMRELLTLSGGRIKCISDIPRGRGPIVVCGSGSSLDAIAPTLKDWNGAVMCSTSQASTLVKYGRFPDYITCMDPRDADQDELTAPDWADSVLMGHVSIPHTYIARWLRRARGNIYLGRIMEPSYAWYSHHLGRGYPWIRHIILPMIDSAASNVGFATWLGYSPIYLAGVDYSGPRFDRYDWDYDKKEWKLDSITSKYDVKTSKEDFSGMSAEGVMQYSSRGTLISGFFQIANQKYQQRIYQLSKTTVLKQFPYVPWDYIVRDMEPSILEYDRQAILDDIEMALAVWGTYIVPLNGGWGQDYHTYIAEDEENFYQAMAGYNKQVRNNLRDFERLEHDHKKSIKEMMQTGVITIEAGDLLLHGAEEFQEWDWRKMGEIDIPVVLMRRRWLLEEAAKHGYVRGKIRKLRELLPGDTVEPHVQTVIDMNKVSRQAITEAVNKSIEGAQDGK